MVVDVYVASSSSCSVDAFANVPAVGLGLVIGTHILSCMAMPVTVAAFECYDFTSV
jgi:hypothetical protein